MVSLCFILTNQVAWAVPLRCFLDSSTPHAFVMYHHHHHQRFHRQQTAESLLFSRSFSRSTTLITRSHLSLDNENEDNDDDDDDDYDEDLAQAEINFKRQIFASLGLTYYDDSPQAEADYKQHIFESLNFEGITYKRIYGYSMTASEKREMDAELKKLEEQITDSDVIKWAKSDLSLDDEDVDGDDEGSKRESSPNDMKNSLTGANENIDGGSMRLSSFSGELVDPDDTTPKPQDGI